jgi:L-alanine-DL-glutamate epimerase-like enolase superfamily enzyme
MSTPRIVTIEWARLEGRRPRAAGCNARLGAHGEIVRVPLARLTTDDGSQGFGVCRATPEQAAAILGQPLDALFDPQQGATALGMPFDFPLWDLAGQRAGQPVYALAATLAGQPPSGRLTVPCYDTSLYMDDLHLTDDQAGAELIAAEAREGWARGHRSFKIKVGRGARHMPLEAGTRRDIAVIQAVRAAVGPDATILIDANNGYTLNLAKSVLAATADCDLFWLEEAFHEDRVLYEDLQAWLRAEGLPVLIADGEGQASPSLLEWAEAGVIQVVQYDIFGYGFTPWLALGRRLDGWGVRSAPHHYGGHYGNYVAGHLAAAVQHFAFVEWDEATTPGLETGNYAVMEGRVAVPNAPGFGLTLDETSFQQAVAAGGMVWRV